MTGLQWMRMEFPFAKGLNQKVDPRLVQAPELVRAVNIEHDELGGLRLRYPFANIGSNIFGGGTISGCRRIYAVGNELILFTQTGLYSWSSQRSAWVLKGTHLAIKMDEEPVFVTTGDQIECDRAELNGTVVYTWSDASQVYAAAVDKATGAVLASPTAISGAVERPRVVALQTKILLFAVTSTPNLVVRAVDPAAPATGFASAATILVAGGAGFDDIYDVVAGVDDAADRALFAVRLTPNTSYTVGTVTTGLVSATSTKARPCSGPIAIACNTTGETALVVRADGTNIEGDFITIATLADAANVNLAIGTGTSTINNVTAVFRNEEQASVFWTSNQQTNATDWDTDYNTVDIDGTLGTAASFIRRLALASRAFVYDQQAYIWLQFFGESSFSGASPSEFRAQLQNTYFLYRADGLLCGKAAWQRSAGTGTQGHLPGVALTSGTTGFSWCGGERRIVPLGDKHLGYADRGPRDITFTFDSNEARRVAKIGNTVYITGAEILAYDGTELVEAGFHLYPHYFGAIEVGTGNVADGTYTLKVSWRYDNKRGERERSTTATTGQVTIAAGPNGISTVSWIPLYATHKGNNVVVESWRTPVNATDDSPFYLTTSQDPASTTNPNRYVANDTTAGTLPTFNDELADADLTTKETHPENFGVLENMGAPAATLIVANDTRLFLAGIAGAPHTVVYSKQREDGQLVAWNEALSVQIPEAGGPITGLAFLNETLIVFRETAIYALSGAGYDNTGGGANYEPRLLSSTEGAVNHESIALTPMGLIFKSNKGWYLLNRGWSTEYIGAPVCDYDSETVYAAHVIENRHQVRILTSGRMLVLDYVANAWSEWSISDGLHACMWNGTHHYLATAAVKAEQASYATADYGWDVEMLIHLNGLQGFARCRRVMVLGEVRGSGSIRVRIGGYQEATYFDDKTWTISPTTAGAELNFQHGPSRQQEKAFRIRLTSQTTAGEKPKLSAIALEVGLKGPLFRHLPAAQRQ